MGDVLLSEDETFSFRFEFMVEFETRRQTLELALTGEADDDDVVDGNTLLPAAEYSLTVFKTFLMREDTTAKANAGFAGFSVGLMAELNDRFGLDMDIVFRRLVVIGIKHTEAPSPQPTHRPGTQMKC